MVPSAEPEVPVTYNEFRALTASGRTGEAMVIKKLDREQRLTRLTKREEDDSIGDWLFGVGGIRGLRCVCGCCVYDTRVRLDAGRVA